MSRSDAAQETHGARQSERKREMWQMYIVLEMYARIYFVAAAAVVVYCLFAAVAEYLPTKSCKSISSLVNMHTIQLFSCANWNIKWTNTIKHTLNVFTSLSSMFVYHWVSQSRCLFLSCFISFHVSFSYRCCYALHLLLMGSFYSTTTKCICRFLFLIRNIRIVCMEVHVNGITECLG